MLNARRLVLFAALAVVLLAGLPTLAHKPSDTYLRLDATGETSETFTAEWDIALRDLELLVGLDANSDGQITWGEVKAQRSAITEYALARLEIKADDAPAALTVSDLMINRHSDGAYAVLVMDTGLPTRARRVSVEYNLLFDLDPTHRGLLLVRRGDTTSTFVLSPERRIATIEGEGISRWQALGQFIVEGVWHIWFGFDHILFLLCLLLPAVWLLKHEPDARPRHQWEPVETFRASLHAVLKIVTLFTLAHSITLWLAVMEYVTLPSRAVEAVIALSIIITALHNLFPVIPVPGWAIAFGFGLIHGFGFASVLTDLGLRDAGLAIALLGFNVGVELGQIAIVLAFMPIAFLLRASLTYRWVVFRGGSIAVLLLAAAWFYERAFNADLGLPL